MSYGLKKQTIENDNDYLCEEAWRIMTNSARWNYEKNLS